MSCLAAVAHVCTLTNPPHSQHEPTCAFCNAAKSGFCESHGRGAVKAISDFADSLKEEEAAHFGYVRTLLELELALIQDDKHVNIIAHAQAGLADTVPRVLEIRVEQARE